MHVLLTFVLFATLTGAVVLLRFRWPYFSGAAKRFMIAAASATFLIVGIAGPTKWSTTLTWVNALLYLAFLLSYEFFVILCTRLHPRWLTTAIAIILIVPLLSASIILPVIELFRPPTSVVSLGDGFVSERYTWGNGGTRTSGTDLTIYYRPAWMPFMRHERLSSRYYGGQCNAWAAYAVLQPDHESALMVCPPWPGQTVESNHRRVWSFK